MKAISEVLSRYEQRELDEKEFIEQKKYLSLIDKIVDKRLDNQDYQEPSRWTEEIDILFDFLYDGALQLIIKSLNFDDEVVISYKSNLISLVEMHGQGCFKCIQPVTNPADMECPEYLVDFDDIVNYCKNGYIPMRTKILKTVFVALDSFKVVTEHYNTSVDIDEIKEYLQENLN